jgi:7,8-dihydroneopterin aldolase/epimerase/oxygenase
VTDRIAIRGLRARGRHGLLAEERRDGQDFLVDVVLALDTRAAAAADDLGLTVDYGRLVQRLAAVVSGEPVDLIETLAARLAAECLQDRRVDEVEVTVHKPAAPVAVPVQDVSVTVSRRR